MAANLAPGSWRRLWAVGGGFALAVGLLVLFISSRQEASLLRADPDAAIEDPGVRRSAIAGACPIAGARLPVAQLDPLLYDHGGGDE